MAITITHLSRIKDASIPFCGGVLEVLLVDDVTGDTPDAETGQRILTYKDGMLINNFVLAWTSLNGNGTSNIFGTASSFIKVFGLLPERAAAIEDYITHKLHNEIPIMSTKAWDFDDPDVITFSNLVDIYRDIYGEDSEEFKSRWTPEIQELIGKNVYIRNVLAKLAQMIRTGFNEAYHENVADSIVKLIQASKHIRSDETISGPTMSSVEDLFRIVRDKLAIQPLNGPKPSVEMNGDTPIILK